MMNLELFDKIPFFESFSEEQLQRLYPLTERRMYRPAEVIRSQGDVNFELCFLLHGSVDVKVDEQFVVTINDYGEIFGEMSGA
jgi:signal-transduction protein with cAMP-binding, CBS, and nucleotidyltransferase domain